MLLVPLAVFGAPALARSGSAGSQYGSGSAQYQYRVSICHRTGSKKHPGHTITVSAAAVRAHLRHGDHLGRCTGAETVRGKSHGKPAKPHHDSGKKAKGDDGSSSPAAPEHGNGHGDKGHHGK
jgi:hypothetical protein